MNRRQFLTIGSLGALAAAGGASASTVTSEDLESVEVPISEPSVPPPLDGYRIAFLTDLHVAPCLSDALAHRALALARDFKPDILLLGGDYIWHSQGLPTQAAISLKARSWCFQSNEREAKQVYEGLRSTIHEIRPAERTFGVLGNHDRWAAEIGVVRGIESADTRLLINDTVTITRGSAVLRLIGVDDYWTGMPRVPDLPTDPGSEEYRIVISHNPDFLSWLLHESATTFHLGLGGHTHGGQVKLPLVGAPFYNVSDRRLGEGMFRHPRGITYTSRGVGMAWFPIRINCRPEITLITLRHRPADENPKNSKRMA